VSIQAKRQDRFLGETRLLDLQLAALVMVATRMAAIDPLLTVAKVCLRQSIFGFTQQVPKSIRSLAEEPASYICRVGVPDNRFDGVAVFEYSAQRSR
jgi:hypothetical protein